MRKAIVAVFLLVLCLAGLSRPPVRAQDDTRPLVILVSFDGWRSDYETKAPTPNLRQLAARGVRAVGLIPSYPSKTVPNHYTIATGLYPGHHGMVANVIRDPASGRLFDRSDRAAVGDPMWWGGEPIWNTAQRSGLSAATMFWPGSEAPVGGMRPAYWREFDESVSAQARVDQVLKWLDLPVAKRPALITLYLNDTDTIGHWYGPDSRQIRDAIRRTDQQLGRLLDGLRKRQLMARANLVIVSDHGMAATTSSRTIFVDDYVALEDIEIADINPTLGITPKSGREDDVYRRLAGAHPHLTMYRRADTPVSWHFRDQPRVPPITGVADEGWVVMRHSGFDEYWKHSPNGGQHGYDPSAESMRGIFIAAGPAFKADLTVPAFENVQVYNVLARVLGVKPAANDGDAAFASSLIR